MSEKQFDHIENRIREAAENSEPDFDEYAWTLMEARLDAENKRRRRPIVWVIVFSSLFIIVGGFYFFRNNQPAEIKNSQHVENMTIEEKSGQQKIITGATQAVISPGSDTNPNATINTKVTSGVGQGTKKVFSDNHFSADNLKRIPGKRSHQSKGKLTSNTIAAESSEDGDIAAGVDKSDNIPIKPGGNEITGNIVNDVVQDNPIKNDTTKVGINKVVTDSNSNKKVKTSKPSHFYLIGAIGIDAGSVDLLSFNNSQVTAKYGVGIGYQLSKKISVQTGFYASQKKYIAGPEDYYAKPGSYWSMVQIVKVDAACLVYDIPITIRFDFLQKPKTTYYATAGISSYIMKKEDYNYYYNRNNVARQSAKTYTGNIDPFSVINLSAGIEKKLSPKFYIQAEPSIGIPLSGVGEGSVKLYSAALQVAIKYQPVKKH